MKKICENLKYIKMKDILSAFLFIIILPIALVYKLINKIRNKSLWLICEAEDTARDNGYHLFKYIRENNPEDFCFYVINKKCSDYNKIKKYGNIIQFSSLKHWLYYLAADKNISTQKAGNPNAPLFYVLQVYGILRNKRVFLQHGIIKDDLPYVYYKNTKFRLFICGAKREYEYVKENFGYPKGYVKYTGLARFDNLHNNKVNKKQILIIPTWRNWLGRDLNSLSKHEDFTKTTYFKHWNNLIKNKEFNDLLEKNGMIAYFYPHIHMQKYLKYFNGNSNRIKVVNNDNIDIQDLLKKSALMITDYSSVFMDFAYMRKPILFYQFDKAKFREKHLAEGYFSYEHDGFGDVIENEDILIRRIKEYIDNSYYIEKKYIERMTNFFELYDTNNCKRIYDSIKEI